MIEAEEELSLDDLLKLINRQISLFFEDKEMHYGGPIPKRILKTPHYINLLANIDLTKAIDLTYESLGIREEELNDEDDVPESVQKVINILGECARSGVAKEFAGGILLMYMELCEGIKVY